MNREQVKVLQANGFSYEALPNLVPQPRATYYSRDLNTGEVNSHELPADPYSLNHYLKKGFVLNPGDLKPQVVDTPLSTPVVESPQDSVPVKRHYRKHNKRVKKEI